VYFEVFGGCRVEVVKNNMGIEQNYIIGCEFLTYRPVFISAIRMVKYLFKCFSFFGFGGKMYLKVG
jgi:hypothetical protein